MNFEANRDESTGKNRGEERGDDQRRGKTRGCLYFDGLA